MQVSIIQRLKEMYQEWCGEAVVQVLPLPQSGSERRYFRLTGSKLRAIGSFNPIAAENRAFVAYSQHFKDKGILVPSIYAVDEHHNLYLQEDLGDLTLLQYLNQRRAEEQTVPPDVIAFYQTALSDLAQLQIVAARGLDPQYLYPVKRFDEQVFLWDFYHFKYYFLQPLNIRFDDYALERDFRRLAQFLSDTQGEYFVYRDFQARNIMIKDKELYYIDYQSGRIGALEYDVASLLWQAKAALPFDLRERLLEDYIQAAQKYIPLDASAFRQRYLGHVLARCLQVLGAYGFRGIFQRKAHFLDSIPYALENIRYWIANYQLPFAFETLPALLEQLPDAALALVPSQRWTAEPHRLTVRVCSFSYRRGLPQDHTGNGGGFVFDCRCITNPGRQEEFKHLTGRDAPVADFLRQQPEMQRFLANAFAIVDSAVENYINRHFTHLLVSFGCTGGQHRSVFSADALAAHLRVKYPNVAVVQEHIEQELKDWVNQ